MQYFRNLYHYDAPDSLRLFRRSFKAVIISHLQEAVTTGNMDNKLKIPLIIYADDDPEDIFLIQNAFNESMFEGELRFVNNGEELMDYLRARGRYNDPVLYPKPDLILLDLNMPRMDGREALAEIKSDVKLRSLPIVIFTTSNREEDIVRSYELGANSYITKPMTFEGFIKITDALGKYWFQISKLPLLRWDME